MGNAGDIRTEEPPFFYPTMSLLSDKPVVFPCVPRERIKKEDHNGTRSFITFGDSR